MTVRVLPEEPQRIRCPTCKRGLEYDADDRYVDQLLDASSVSTGYWCVRCPLCHYSVSIEVAGP